MRGLGDSTQHELKVLGEQVVHTGRLARLAAIIAKDKPKHADFDAYELSSGRLGPRRLMRTRLSVYAARDCV